jgi:hypothetical protein
MDLVTLAMAKKYTNDAIAEAATGEVDLSAYAKTAYVDEKVAGLVESAPDTLNTLNELAAALGDDPNFATTIATQIGGKVDKTSLGALATKSTVAKSDLATAVQTSLGKADTALQSFTETDPTVPAWAKEENKPTYTASEVGAVPTTRTVNNKALSANISLTASDVGALPNTTTLFSGNYNDLTNKPTIPSIDGLATTSYVDNAVANKEFILNSTTEGSTKKFRVTVDDTGTLTAVEITE